MQLRTSTGGYYTIQWAAVTNGGLLFVQMEDARPLSSIAAEFEGLEWLRREDENEGDRLFDGFGLLNGIKRIEPGVVQMALERGV